MPVERCSGRRIVRWRGGSLRTSVNCCDQICWSSDQQMRRVFMFVRERAWCGSPHLGFPHLGSSLQVLNLSRLPGLPLLSSPLPQSLFSLGLVMGCL